MISESIRRIIDGHHLSRAESEALFGEVMNGSASEVQKTALLIGLRMKGETIEEITGAAAAMRRRVIALDVDGENLVDTCGTGGDGKGTLNVSTIAAIVAAAAGVTIAKHGNRAVSSSCGSADVLMALGVRIDLDARQMKTVLDRVGLSFLFAPRLHPATAAVSAVRKELGLRTIFNLLGPLTNPAGAARQVVGVYAAELVPKIGEVLRALGTRHALVVHSEEGLDEISPSAPTEVCEVKRGEVPRSFRITPEEIGLSGASSSLDLQGGDAATNARLAREILEGSPGAGRDAVLANAGAAIYVGGVTPSIREGVDVARKAIDEGRALAKLEELIAATVEEAAAE
ncbi:MAG TPA: anthranilate phosphoribosyltransferase [Thermoanaerobaculia bacterium]|nr:anthranilate phosphoribosyltransferase [Thermoanaerobaculia bacterium]